MGLSISPSVRQKLSKKTPPVVEEEIEQCFANRTGKLLEDIREQHRSDPPTQWFIAQTDYGRFLKVAFIHKADEIIIRTAYDPNPKEKEIYSNYGKP